MSSATVSSGDVLKLIGQFLSENGLQRTLQTLSEESNTSLATHKNPKMIADAIREGNYSVALNELSGIRLSLKSAKAIHWLTAAELFEVGEIEGARAVIKSSPVLQSLKMSSPSEFLALESLGALKSFDEAVAYHGGSKQDARNDAARLIEDEVSRSEGGRLLTLLGQSLKFQRLTGLLPCDGSLDLDLFAGTAVDAGSAGAGPAGGEAAGERVPSTEVGKVKFGKKYPASCVAFSPDGRMIAVGLSDGLIEVYDPATSKLRRGLDYQDQDKFMAMEDGVLCAWFSDDGELLGTGSKDGKVKIWKVSSGQCLRKIERAHGGPVGAISLSKDCGRVLTGGFDGSVALHGVRSGARLKEMKGHTAFVNGVSFLGQDNSRAVSVSSDGTVRVWGCESGECIASTKPNPDAAGEIRLHSLCPLFRGSTEFIVGASSSSVYLMNDRGKVVRSFSSSLREANGGVNPEFSAVTVSQRGTMAFAVAENHSLYAFHITRGTLEGYLEGVDEAETLALTTSPQSNALGLLSASSVLKIFK